jgi:hypothetical protein
MQPHVHPVSHPLVAYLLFCGVTAFSPTKALRVVQSYAGRARPVKIVSYSVFVSELHVMYYQAIMQRRKCRLLLQKMIIVCLVNRQARFESKIFSVPTFFPIVKNE